MRGLAMTACAVALAGASAASAADTDAGIAVSPEARASADAVRGMDEAQLKTLARQNAIKLSGLRLDRMVRRVGPATSDRAVSSGDKLELKADKGDSAVSFTLDVPVQTPAWQSLSLTASAPLEQGAGSADVATLDGMAKGFSLELKASGTYRALRKSPAGRADGVDPDARLAGACAAFYAAARVPASTCDLRRLGRSANGRASLDALDDETHQGASYAWGLTSKVGDKRFKFYDPASLAPLQSNKTQWSVGAFWAFHPTASDGSLAMWLLTARYEHQRAYDDADSKNMCPVSAGPGPVTCITGPIGAPSLATKELVSLELRAQPFKTYAFSVLGSYDARGKVWAIDAPIYLVSDGDKSLAGGVRLGWRSDSNAVTVGVFVSQAFDLTSGL